MKRIFGIASVWGNTSGFARIAFVMLSLIVAMVMGWIGKSAEAAVAAAQPFPNTPTISGTTSASVSGSYTVNAGSNRLLVVSVSASFSATPTSQSVSATYGGQALTQMIVSPVNQRRFVWIGYLKESGIAAASGTTLQVTLANNTSLNGTETYASVLTGVDQTSTINATYSVYINNTSAILDFGSGLAVQTGGFSLYGVTVNNATAPTISGDTGYTLTTMNQIAAASDYAFTGSKAFASAGTADPVNTFGANIRGGISAATINPSSAPTPGTVALSSSTYSAGEADGTVTITVNRTGGTSGAASVQYATGNGTATAPADYGSTSGTLNWADGDGTAKTFLVTINDDSSVESSEDFTVTLSNATGATLGTPNSATVTITDDDVAPPSGTLQFSTTAYTDSEGFTSATITVTRINGSAGAASVQYATSNGTATAPGDYTSTSGTLNWTDADSASKTFVVTIVNDTTEESDETVNLTLSNATGATLGTPSSATLTITDNDGAVPQTPAGSWPVLAAMTAGMIAYGARRTGRLGRKDK